MPTDEEKFAEIVRIVDATDDGFNRPKIDAFEAIKAVVSDAPKSHAEVESPAAEDPAADETEPDADAEPGEAPAPKRRPPRKPKV